MCKNKNLLKSQKGDAIILLSVIVTGIVMLITAAAVESLRKSAEIQSYQKQSVDSLYKAEEGVEYSLYANKEKNFNETEILNPDFSISVFKEDNLTGTTGLQALTDLAQPAQNQNVIVTSENSSNLNNNKQLKRTVFANMPSRYLNQVPLWNFRNSCVTTGCESDNNLASGYTYQVILTTADFQKDGWDLNNTLYRLVFNCTDSINGCGVQNLKVGVGCGFNQCPVADCATFMDIEFSNDSEVINNKKIMSDWFRFFNGDDILNPIQLTNSQILVQFELTSGSMEEITNLTGSDIKMCRGNTDGSWTPSTDKVGGLSSVEFKKINENIQYTCVEREQICTQMCSPGHNICCPGAYNYYCAGYPYNDTVCVPGAIGYPGPGGCCNWYDDGWNPPSCLNYCAEGCSDNTCCDGTYDQNCVDGECIRYTFN